jgi:hypothetical protein
MIKHIVMWNFKEQALGNDRKTNALLARDKLNALEGKIPGLLKIEAGIDFSATPQSADLILYSEFESVEALQAYQIHPEHEAVKNFIVAITDQRLLGDYET